MIIYQTADGTQYTRYALYRKVVEGRKEAWDPALEGEWENDQRPFFKDWLIEAINTGVIKQSEVEPKSIA